MAMQRLMNLGLRRAKEYFLHRPFFPNNHHHHLGRHRRPMTTRDHNLIAFVTGGSIVALTAYYNNHLEIVPYTNRTHFVLMSPSTERLRGNRAFDKLKPYLDTLPPTHPDYVRVRFISDKIINTVHRDGIATTPFDWEVVVVRDDYEFKASYSLGGKIFIYTGLLRHLTTDAEIARVISHEVAHGIARHRAEGGATMWFLFRQLLYMLVTEPYITIWRSRQLLVSQLLGRYFSRRKEIEADYIGLLLLASAGYDPREVPKMHEKLGQIARKRKNIFSTLRSYFSIYPSREKRAQLASLAMEEALAIYQKSISNVAEEFS